MAFAFEKLLVYQKAIGFSDRICQLTGSFPRGFWFLADQLNRAALSVATNITEGNGRFTKADRKNLLGFACGGQDSWSRPAGVVWAVLGESRLALGNGLESLPAMWQCDLEIAI